MAPIWLALAGVFWLKEPADGRTLLSLAVSMVGVAIIVAGLAVLLEGDAVVAAGCDAGAVRFVADGIAVFSGSPRPARGQLAGGG
ncbi:MAG TPA: hypothetical protein VMS17_00710, partial [Gemmataceae bacterium]|nr:hypothetical protein [Gemmataceae bacterium]